jgi:hypothetical protein
MRIFIIPLSLFFLMAFKHPFYLSVTDLKYNAQDEALQGSVKLFVNDLEAALKKINKQTVDLIHVKDTVQIKKLLRNYLLKNLSLKINGLPKAFDFIGFEREQEAIWMYIEFKKCQRPKKIELENSLLFDDIMQQTNIVHIEVCDERKSLKSNYPDKQFLFEF